MGVELIINGGSERAKLDRVLSLKLHVDALDAITGASGGRAHTHVPHVCIQPESSIPVPEASWLQVWP